MGKKTIEQVADVQFWKSNDAEEVNAGCNPFAYFPTIDWDREKKLKTCYSIVEQHSGCDPEYLKQCTLATRDEYLPLKLELVSIGYNINVLNQD